MASIVIKTPNGKYVGGGRNPELVERLSRADVYEDHEEVDAQIAIVNTMYGWNWQKVDAEQEYDKQLEKQGG